MERLDPNTCQVESQFPRLNSIAKISESTQALVFLLPHAMRVLITSVLIKCFVRKTDGA